MASQPCDGTDLNKPPQCVHSQLMETMLLLVGLFGTMNPHEKGSIKLSSSKIGNDLFHLSVLTLGNGTIDFILSVASFFVVKEDVTAGKAYNKDTCYHLFHRPRLVINTRTNRILLFYT